MFEVLQCRKFVFFFLGLQSFQLDNIVVLKWKNGY